MPLKQNLSGDDHIREFTFPDGKRRIAFHRKHVAFICELETAGHVLIAARADAKPCPVLGEYADVLTWWKGEAKGKAALSRDSQGQSNAPKKNVIASEARQSAAYPKPGDVKESRAGVPTSGRPVPGERSEGRGTGRPILTLPKQIERKASTASGLSNAVDRAEGGVSRRSIPQKGKSAAKAL